MTASSSSIESSKISGSTWPSRNASTDSKFPWERNPTFRLGPFLIASLSWSKFSMFSYSTNFSASKLEQSARNIASESRPIILCSNNIGDEVSLKISWKNNETLLVFNDYILRYLLTWKKKTYPGTYETFVYWLQKSVNITSLLSYQFEHSYAYLQLFLFT